MFFEKIFTQLTNIDRKRVIAPRYGEHEKAL